MQANHRAVFLPHLCRQKVGPKVILVGVVLHGLLPPADDVHEICSNTHRRIIFIGALRKVSNAMILAYKLQGVPHNGHILLPRHDKYKIRKVFAEVLYGQYKPKRQKEEKRRVEKVLQVCQSRKHRAFFRRLGHPPPTEEATLQENGSSC